MNSLRARPFAKARPEWASQRYGCCLFARELSRPDKTSSSSTAHGIRSRSTFSRPSHGRTGGVCGCCSTVTTLHPETHDPFHCLRELSIGMSDIRDAMYRFANVYYSKEYGPNWFGLASLKAAQDAALAIFREKNTVTLPNVTEKLRGVV